MNIRKKFLLMVVFTLCLAACGGNQNSESEPTVPLETSTPLSIATSTQVPTPTQTPTPMPQPVQISSDNIDLITMEKLLPLERKHLGSADTKWNVAQWSPDNAHLVVHTSKGIDIYTNTLELVAEYTGITPVNFLENGDIFAQTIEGLVIFNYSTGESIELGYLELFTVEDEWPFMVSNDDGSQIAVVIDGNRIDLIEVVANEIVTLDIIRNVSITSIMDLNYLPDGQKLIVSGQDRSLRTVNLVIDIFTGEVSIDLLVFSLPPVEISPSGEYFAYRSDGGASLGYIVRLDDGLLKYNFSPGSSFGDWDTPTSIFSSFNNALYSFKGNDETLGVLYLGFSGTKESNGPAESIIVWDLLGDKALSTFNDIGTFPKAFAFSPDGSLFFTSGDEGIVRVFDGNSGELINQTPRYATGGAPVFSRDGSLVAVPGVDVIKILETDILEEVETIYLDLGHLPNYVAEEFITSVDVFFLDNDHLVIAYAAAYYRIYDLWSIAEQRITRTIRNVVNCNLPPSSERIICEKPGKSLQVFDVELGDLVSNYKIETTYKLDDTGAFLAACTDQDLKIKVIDLSTAGFSYVNQVCQPFAFNPAGTNLLLQDGTLVNIDSGDVLQSLDLSEGETLRLDFVYFNLEETLVVVDLYVFDLTTGELLITLDGPQELYGAELSADNLTLTLLTDRGVETWGVRE